MDRSWWDQGFFEGLAGFGQRARRALTGQNPFVDWREFEDSPSVTEVLETWGLPGNETAGSALEAIANPLNLIPAAKGLGLLGNFGANAGIGFGLDQLMNAIAPTVSPKTVENDQLESLLELIKPVERGTGYRMRQMSDAMTMDPSLADPILSPFGDL